MRPDRLTEEIGTFLDAVLDPPATTDRKVG
jgi:hypothetical protein